MTTEITPRGYPRRSGSVAIVAQLLSVADALAAVLARVEPLPAEDVELESAAGRVLAEPVSAAVDLPPFPSSSMDGYAVRSGDVPGSLHIVGTVAAGRPETRAVGPGEAIEISTGGVVPEGADAVVPVELVEVRDGAVAVDGAVVSGANVRRAGGDVTAGATVLEARTVLTPARLAALAACGVERVRCARRPRVSVVVTGTELRRPGEPLEPGQIYESNGLMVGALCEASGAEVHRRAAAEDTEEATESALREALEADVVVTTGGVSVGPHDLVRRVEARLGVEEVFWGVAMRPGKPLAFGMRGATVVFGLPGNPVSSLVGGLLFVRPALLALQGHPSPEPPFWPGVLAREVQPRAERDDFVRARLDWSDDGAVLDPITGQESHMIVRSTAADAIVHVPRADAPLPAGSRIRFLAL
jgi:molybdopterin molybdotransferase